MSYEPNNVIRLHMNNFSKSNICNMLKLFCFTKY